MDLSDARSNLLPFVDPGLLCFNFGSFTNESQFVLVIQLFIISTCILQCIQIKKKEANAKHVMKLKKKLIHP